MEIKHEVTVARLKNQISKKDKDQNAPGEFGAMDFGQIIEESIFRSCVLLIQQVK